ncbi:arginine--tRNA ligase [SAR86 cluster bacterium]|nr:arginine--tRNA ligase [SAR86 cluster bacterium]
MKEDIQNLLYEEIKSSNLKGVTKASQIEVFEPKNLEFGDWTSNICMKLAANSEDNPRQIAEKLITNLTKNDWITKIEIAGAGFLNFYLTSEQKYIFIQECLEQEEPFLIKGKTKQKILIEYVSSNPTGPIHIGHGRGAALGSALANLLSKAGSEVTQEYYVNDQGLQIETLGLSLLLNYLSLGGDRIKLPKECYQGDYLKTLASDLKKDKKNKYEFTLPKKLPTNFDDWLILAKKELSDFEELGKFALTNILDGIKTDLKEFNTFHDDFFFESSLFKDSKKSEFHKTLNFLSKKDLSYNKDGAIWYKSTDFGDEKDRVLIRENEAPTYFASDLVYHKNKFDRKFDEMINLWGSDHHGYLPRINASLNGLGYDSKKLKTIFIQFVSLIRGKNKVAMSTRSGEFVTLRKLIDEVGVDAVRYFFLERRSDQTLEFDIELAKKKNKDNPVYYIQYAHARICSLMKELPERGFNYSNSEGFRALSSLSSDKENELVSQINSYQQTLERCFDKREIHSLCFYLRDLAAIFHSFYNSHPILDKDDNSRNARIAVSLATKAVINDGLGILGIVAPEKM